MDSRIILAGEPVNALGSFMGGQQAAQQTRQFQQQNALADLYKTQGAGIMAGDVNALNALAGIDPAAAMQFKTQQQGLAMDQRRLEILNEQEKRAAAEYAAGLTAQQRAAEAAQIEDAVKMGLSIPDAATWDATMGQMAPELVGKFDLRQSLANRYMSMVDILKTQGPTEKFRPATPDEAAKYGAAGGQIGTDGRFYPINPPSGMSIRTNPDGTMEMVQGAGAGGKPFTEAQGKDVAYATRAEGALQTFAPVSDALTSRSGQIAEAVPFGLARGLQSDQYQVALNAGREFTAAILRKDSGAALTANEERIYGEIYLPQPGDSDALLSVKRAARQRALAALKSGMSPDQILAQGRALVSSAAGAAPVQNPSAQSGEPVVIKDDAEFDALPSGAEFVGPDGVRRRKP